MKKLFFFISAFIALFINDIKAQQPEHPFLYPVPPESLETLQERTSFLVEHFWDRCNLKSIFASRKNFEQAMDDYFSFMPYADSAVVFNSVDNFIKEVKKSGPNTLTMVEVARAKLYSDSAEYLSDELYLPFARAAVNASGINKELKSAYQLEISQLENSLVGKKVAPFTMTLRDGSKKDIDEITDSYVLIFFDEPDNFDNTMARVRLSTDYSLNDLIKSGYVKVISLYAGQPDATWRDRTADYPDNWIIAASPQAVTLFDQRVKPTFYYLNKEHQILSKTLEADNLVDAFRTVLGAQNRIKAERERLRQEALKQKNSQ